MWGQLIGYGGIRMDEELVGLLRESVEGYLDV
jgi:hypothetical protein